MIASEALPPQFNVATWFVDRNVEEGRAASPAFHCDGRTLTYGDVQALANRTGNALLEGSTPIALAYAGTSPLSM